MEGELGFETSPFSNPGNPALHRPCAKVQTQAVAFLESLTNTVQNSAST